MLCFKYPKLLMSINTVGKARYELGWVVTMPKYCKIIREANRLKWLEWCQEMINTNEQFDNVVVADEQCSVRDSQE